MGHMKQESLKSLSDANHHSSNHSYSRGRSTAQLGGGQVVSVPPSKGRVARVVDVPVGGRHSHASNYSRTIAATGSLGGFSAQNIGTKTK